MTLCDPLDCSMPVLPDPHHLLELSKFLSIASVMPSSHLIHWHPLLLLPSIFPSIRVFSNESAVHIRWPKYWSFSFSFSINPSNEYSVFIFSKIDWFDLLAVQGTLKRLLQHHGSKALILQHSAFFMVQLSQPYMTTGKTIALAIQTFFGKWCFAFQYTLSLSIFFFFFVIDFRPGSNHLISWQRGDFRAQKEEIHCWFHLCPFYLPWNDGAGCNDLKFFVFFF